MDLENLSLKKIAGIATLAFAGVAGIATVSGSFYTVEQHERAVVKRMGKLQDGIKQPGFQTKVPFVDEVVKFNMKPRQLELKKLETYTSDNQPIWSTLNIVYKPLESSITRFVNEPGWENRIEGVALSRYKEVMGTRDAVAVAQHRKAISVDLTTAIKAAAKQQIGIEVDDVQLTDYTLDSKYMEHIREVGNAKAITDKATQDQKTKTIEARNAEIVSEGIAKAAIQTAEGAAQSARKAADAEAYARKANAEANAVAIEREGQAKANALKVQLQAVGGDNRVLVDLANADAWKSGGAKMPETLVTGGNTTTLLGPATRAAAGFVAPKP